MAIQGPVRVEFGEVFPLGAFAVAVEPVRDFERSSRENTVQARDKDTGELVWAVEVLDADPAAGPRASDRSVKVKITAPVMPVLPDVMTGTPFRPVEFEGLRMRPYVNSNTNRLAYSFTARGMRPADSSGKSASGSSNTSGKSNAVAAAA